MALPQLDPGKAKDHNIFLQYLGSQAWNLDRKSQAAPQSEDQLGDNECFQPLGIPNLLHRDFPTYWKIYM